jgi:hypothetical protein
MNESLKVISSLKLSSGHVSICEINSLVLAATLYKGKVLLISQEDPMTVTNSIEVSNTCRGIEYNDGMIYVCCGGWNAGAEGAGCIKVFSVSGGLRYELSYHGGIEWPRRIVFSSSSNDFSVFDGYQGIIHIDKNRSMNKVNVDSLELPGPSSICKINKSLFCVALTSSNLLLMSHDGKYQVELLAGLAGKSNLQGMCFDNETSRLVVSHSDSDKIFVYTLK